MPGLILRSKNSILLESLPPTSLDYVLVEVVESVRSITDFHGLVFTRMFWGGEK